MVPSHRRLHARARDVRRPTATAVPARTDPRAQLLAVLEEVDETSREASRSIEGLSKCLTDTKIRTEALALNGYLVSLGTHTALAASRIRAGDDARGAQRLHEMLRKDPRKALKTVTYFRGPGAPMLGRAGYQGNGLDATERLISTIRDALPALGDYIARHDSDFPEQSATTAMAWTILYRHGGYWWDGTAWHRPGQVMDRAYEGYDARPVKDAATVTAADLLDRPGEPGNARIAKIADFTAPKEPLPRWRDHLALWAASRRPGSLPLDRCVIDLRAPELEPAHLVDRAGLAQIAGLALDDLPHPEYGRRSLPVPQTETAEGPRWSQPVARDWAEQHHRAHGPQTLLSGTTTFGTEQPLGLVTDHNRLTKIISDSLKDADSRPQKRGPGRGKTGHEESAAELAWWPAVALSDRTNGLIPVAALRTTLVEAVVGGLAEDVERAGKKDRTGVSLGDIRRDVVRLLDWYILRQPDRTPVLFGEICLLARVRLGLEPRDVGDLLRRSLHLDSELDGETVDALLDLALPPSARRAEDC